ncbi:MAG: prolipoprotein diacylglyceryl transferase [bacterium]
MHPTIAKIGPFVFHTYGLMVATGVLLWLAISLYFAKKEKIEAQTIFDLAIYVIIASVIGARLFYVLGQPEYFRRHPFDIIMVQNGGLVFLGGLILGLLSIIIFAKKYKLPLAKILDILTPGVIIGYALGRIGCFFNGCCFGLPTELPWGMAFPHDCLAGTFFPYSHIHPTQLYSSLIAFLIFGLLLWQYPRKSYDGQIFYWGIILYSIYRFLIEFIRFSPMHWFSLTPSQWLSLVILVVVILIFRQKK